MKPVRYSASLAVKVSPEHRRAVEWISEHKQMSLGEATRFLLDYGIAAIGLACKELQPYDPCRGCPGEDCVPCHADNEDVEDERSEGISPG
jgi:hypothetical protein